MQIVIAPGTLKTGITESEMLAASDRFQDEFVVHQPGVLQRVLVTDGSGRYADIVLFADEQAVADVMAAEQTSLVCAAFMEMWDGDVPTMHEVLRTYGAGLPTGA